MPIKHVLKLFLLHVSLLVIGTCLFILLFHFPLFGGMSILFYRGIMLLVLACFIITVLLLVLKRTNFMKIFTYRDIILSLTIIFCFNMLFFTHVPVTVDRSISVFLLGYMDENHNKVLTESEITNFFTSKYINENQAMKKRFNEQIVSGDIAQVGDGYQITNRGRALVSFFSFIGDLFEVDKKNISP